MAVFGVETVVQGLGGAAKLIETLQRKQGVVTREEFDQVLVLLANARANVFEVELKYRTIADDNAALKEQVAQVEAWKTQKNRYELHEPWQGVFVWALKEDAQPPEPAHWCCVKCYEDGRRSILQRISSGAHIVFLCMACDKRISRKNPDYRVPKLHHGLA